MSLDRRFPSVAYLQRAARRRIPRFAYDYVAAGIGSDVGLDRNRRALDAVTLLPRLMADADNLDLSASVLDQTFDLPFGVAPMGLTGVIWPRAAEFMAAAAKDANIPYVVSTFATTDIETIADVAGAHAWFQLYVPNDMEVRKALIGRAITAGYSVLVVTVDVPHHTRREREVYHGLSVPPALNARSVLQMLARPAWCLASLREGIPELVTFKPYLPADMGFQELGAMVGQAVNGHVTPERLKELRDLWPGKMLVKGVLDPAEAELCRSVGADGIVVSNHGARQLDAGPASVEMIAPIRSAIGTDMALMVDSGVRSGLDVARMIAVGADFVFAGRPFMFGVAAAGEPGAAHVIHILKEELRSTIGQLGCTSIAELPDRLMPADPA